MNRISLLFTQTLSTTQGANRPFRRADENVIKCGGVNRKGEAGGEVSDRAEQCWKFLD